MAAVTEALLCPAVRKISWGGGRGGGMEAFYLQWEAAPLLVLLDLRVGV